MKQVLSKIPFKDYLVVTLISVFVVSLVLEICGRFGLPQTEALEHRQKAKKLSQSTHSKAMIIGDSFCYDLPAQYCRIIAEGLRERGYGVEIFSKSGEGMPFYASMFDRYVKSVKPDLVVLSYYVGNDISNTIRTFDFRGKVKFWIKSDSIFFAKNVIYEIMRGIRSRFRVYKSRKDEANAQKERQIASEASTKRTVATQHDDEPLSPLNPFMIPLAKAQPLYMRENIEIRTESAKQAWKVNRDQLLEMKRASETWGGKLLIVIVPAVIQFSESHRHFFERVGFEISDSLHGNKTPQRLFSEFCKSNGLNCLDLFGEFSPPRKRDWLYIAGDTHWNEEGNQLAASVVLEKINTLLK